MSGYSGVVQSQDTYAAPGVALTVVGAGGGGSNVPANLVVSSISVPAVTNLSSINGVAYVGPTLNPSFNSISTLAISNLSSINGLPYVSTVPLNFSNNSISTNSIIVSSINNFLIDDIPYTYTQPNGLVDTVISSIHNTASPGYNIVQSMIDCGAPLAGHISTVQGRAYTVSGVMRLSPVGGSWPGGSANAYMGIWGGGGASGYVTNALWSYPQIATAGGLKGATPFNTVDLQWIAPGSFTLTNLDQSGASGNSTIQYYAYVSADWPVPVNVQVSSLVGAITNNDINLVKITDNGPLYVSGSG